MTASTNKSTNAKGDDPSAPAALPFDDLERAYERLALAIDTAGPEREALFLARLALVLAHRLPSYAVFDQAVSVALDDALLGDDGAAL